MPWQIGGNFEPVKVICQVDWKGCPKAIANYIWSEIVTDVVDFMSNDGTVWRVIMPLVICFLLLYMFYRKAKWAYQNFVNERGLNKIDNQVQDLELKVNVLTYKIRYGKWPVPRPIQSSALKKRLHNVRLTVSESDERNNWVKHVLLSPTGKLSCQKLSELDRHSVEKLTKIFSMEPTCSETDFQDSTLPVACSSTRLLHENNERISKKGKKGEEKLHLDQQSSVPKRFVKQKGEMESNYIPLKAEKKIMHKPQEIIYEIKQKLESLHDALQIYEMQDLQKNIFNDDKRSSISENIMETLSGIVENVEKINKNINSECSASRKLTNVQQFIPKQSEKSNSLEKSFSTNNDNDKAAVDLSLDKRERNSDPMETDDDMIMTSATSQYEATTESESEDKSTNKLLRRALEYKNTILSEVQSLFSKEYREIVNSKNFSNDDHLRSALLDIPAKEKSLDSLNRKPNKAFLQLRSKPNFNKDRLLKRKLSKKNKEKISKKARKAVINGRNSQNLPKDDFDNYKCKTFGESGSNVSLCDSGTKEALLYEQAEIRNINELVQQGIKDFREYTELFSHNQNEAFVETRKAIQLQNQNEDLQFSMLENIMFDKTADSSSSESFLQMASINNGMNLIKEESFSDNSNLDYQSDNDPSIMALKRRPGMFSLTNADFPQTNLESLSKSRQTFKGSEMKLLHDSCATDKVSFEQLVRCETLNSVNFMDAIPSTSKSSGPCLVMSNKNGESDENLPENEDKIEPNEEEISCKNDSRENRHNDDALGKIAKDPNDSKEASKDTENQRKMGKDSKEPLNSNMNSSTDTTVSYVDASSHGLINPISNGDFLTNNISPSSSGLNTYADCQSSASILLKGKETYVQGTNKNTQVNKSAMRITNPEKLHSKSEKSKSLPTTQAEHKNNRKIDAKSRELSSELINRSSDNSNCDVARGRSKSIVATRKCESSPRDFPKTCSNDSRCSTPETQRRNSMNAASKATGKSSIPVLKTRFDVTRIDARPRSPARGPLTISTQNTIDPSSKSPTTIEAALTQAEGETSRNVESKERVGGAEECSDVINAVLDTQDKVVVYVNIITNDNESVSRIIDPKRFLEYVSGKHLDIRNARENSIQSQCYSRKSIFEEAQQHCVDLTADTSSVNNIAPVKNVEESVAGTDNVLTVQSLPCDSVKNLYSLEFGQREVDVTAKPSVRETSTSISDLRDISILLRNVQTSQIWDVPKELTENECIALLETLNHESNLMHLQKIRNICDKLRFEL
ncbi:uncharacterized protein [Prorops nasuta]|uniref:uncharacterized protein n=1 Tax=Prorops nasuta TaxID=863751 RepID=UPI0034CD6B3E